MSTVQRTIADAITGDLAGIDLDALPVPEGGNPLHILGPRLEAAVSENPVVNATLLTALVLHLYETHPDFRGRLDNGEVMPVANLARARRALERVAKGGNPCGLVGHPCNADLSLARYPLDPALADFRHAGAGKELLPETQAMLEAYPEGSYELLNPQSPVDISFVSEEVQQAIGRCQTMQLAVVAALVPSCFAPGASHACTGLDGNDAVSRYDALTERAKDVGLMARDCATDKGMLERALALAGVAGEAAQNGNSLVSKGAGVAVEGAARLAKLLRLARRTKRGDPKGLAAAMRSIQRKLNGGASLGKAPNDSPLLDMRDTCLAVGGAPCQALKVNVCPSAPSEPLCADFHRRAGNDDHAPGAAGNAAGAEAGPSLATKDAAAGYMPKDAIRAWSANDDYPPSAKQVDALCSVQSQQCAVAHESYCDSLAIPWKDARCACFDAGTPVHTASGPRPIERIQPGDLVWAQDERSHRPQLQRVRRTFITPGKTVLNVHLHSHNQSLPPIGATPNHPFWVLGQGWTGASQLKPGDRLLSPHTHSQLTVHHVQARPGTTTVYNFEVAGHHNYFVGTTPVWVHNMSTIGDGWRTTDVSRAQDQIADRLLSKTGDAALADLVRDAAWPGLPPEASDQLASTLANLSAEELAYLASEIRLADRLGEPVGQTTVNVLQRGPGNGSEAARQAVLAAAFDGPSFPDEIPHGRHRYQLRSPTGDHIATATAIKIEDGGVSFWLRVNEGYKRAGAGTRLIDELDNRGFLGTAQRISSSLEGDSLAVFHRLYASAQATGQTPAVAANYAARTGLQGKWFLSRGFEPEARVWPDGNVSVQWRRSSEHADTPGPTHQASAAPPTAAQLDAPLTSEGALRMLVEAAPPGRLDPSVLTDLESVAALSMNNRGLWRGQLDGRDVFVKVLDERLRDGALSPGAARATWLPSPAGSAVAAGAAGAAGVPVVP